MDKLQPIIKHHFWIVFLIALMLPPVAWWMTTGELAAEISERTSSLDSTFSGIASGQGAPNDDWTNGVNQLIDIRTQANRLALDRLWKAQTDLMVWPPNVAGWMADCPYRGEIDDVRIKQNLPNIYRGDYEIALRRVWLIPEPIDDGKTRVDPELSQKVVFPYASIPRIDATKWSALPPTWQEIWNAQEDLWLLSEVLGAVRKTNDSTSSITDSYVKQILQVQLFGGKRAAAPASAGGSTAGSSYPGSGMPGMMPGMPGGVARRGATAALSKPAEFSISEEYEVAGGGAGGGPSMANYMNEEGGPSAAGVATDPNSDENRYLQAEDAYRTRGFKLKVAIHQMQVPTLIRELLNSQYPIEIIRFQQSAMNPEEPGKPAARKSMYPGGNAVAGLSGGYPDGEGEFPTESEGSFEDYSSEENFGFEGEGGTGGDSLASKSYAIPAIANVQAALEDRDLVELVVVGEIYIYNPPAVDESAAESDGTEQVVSASTTAAPDTGVDGPATPTDTTPAIQTPAADGNAPADSATTLPGEGDNALPGTAQPAPEDAALPDDAAPNQTPGTVDSASQDSSTETPAPAEEGATPSPATTETPDN